MWRYIFSAALCCLLISGFGQEVEKEVKEALVEPVPKFAPRFLQFNYNLFRLGENVAGKPRSSQEIQAELGLHKFLIVADLGVANVTRGGEDYFYESQGNYWRLGIDANLSTAWVRGQVIAIGLRYANASYEDRAQFTRVLANDAIQEFDLSNTNLSSRWAELVFKMRVPVWKNLSTGYTMRYQFYQVTQGLENNALQPLDIPGYGKTNRPNSFQFDYYIGWRLNFVKEQPLPIKGGK
jgi:hypothetical protein